MRITSNAIMKNSLKNFQYNLSKMEKFNEQLSTGKLFTVPSEDPIGSMRSMQLQKIIKENEQYISNIGQGNTWLKLTDTALSEAIETLQRAKELAVAGANDSLGSEEKKAISLEIQELTEHLVQVANTTLGERYIFSGQKTTTSPYTGPTSTYQGASNFINIQIGDNVSMPINIPGDLIFDQALSALGDLKTALDNDDTAAVNASVSSLDTGLDGFLEARAETGAKLNRLELAESRFKSSELNYTELLSSYEDVDIAETIMNLKMQEAVYNASLSAGAKIIQNTLLDFLR